MGEIYYKFKNIFKITQKTVKEDDQEIKLPFHDFPHMSA